MIQWFADLFKNIFKALWDIFKDIFAWLFEKFLEIGIDALREIDLSALDGVTGWGELPSEVLNVLGLLGIGQAASVVVAAIGVRKSLRFIPFIGR
ncbi:MAG: DUF2523 family protein [Brachymonas sp.]|nr:DUF2523 family protein [Brachymonas sp.]